MSEWRRKHSTQEQLYNRAVFNLKALIGIEEPYFDTFEDFVKSYFNAEIDRIAAEVAKVEYINQYAVHFVTIKDMQNG